MKPLADGLSTAWDFPCLTTSDPDPNRWTMAVWRRHWMAPECWMRFDCGMAEFLRLYVQREIPHFWVSACTTQGIVSLWLGQRRPAVHPYRSLDALGQSTAN